jgi:cobalamin biosynthesis protein CobT
MKTKYYGYEFRPAVTLFAHKVCESLGLEPVEVEWSEYTQTACINQHTMILANVRDDALLTLGDLQRYTGFVVHELLHRKYTNFAINHREQYVRTLHNAIEDAWIENKAIQANLTGNIGELLGSLIDSMTTEALSADVDWADPAQYPYVLAVHARLHATLKVPMAHGLAPIFDEAIRRTHLCKSSRDTLAVAVWVYGQLSNLPTEQPQPVNPRPDGDEQGEGDESTQGGDQGNDQGQGEGEGEGEGEPTEGDGDAPTKGGKGSPSPDQEQGQGKVATAPKKGSEATEVEPTNKAPENAQSQGSFSQKTSMQENGYHVTTRKRFTVGI